MPKEVLFILNKLNEEGFDAYIVGGCVRDKLLGLHPHDYDITTSAKPNEIKRVFKLENQISMNLIFTNLTIERISDKIDEILEDIEVYSI